MVLQRSNIHSRNNKIHTGMALQKMREKNEEKKWEYLAQ